MGLPLLSQGPAELPPGYDAANGLIFGMVILVIYFSADPIAYLGGRRAFDEGAVIQRSNGILALGCAIAFIAGFRVANAQFKARNICVFEEFANRSKLLIVAILRFREETGEFPNQLADITPQYLSSVPVPGLRNYPSYDYVSGPVAKPCGSNDWILFVEGKDRDRSAYGVLAYYPNGNYPGGYVFKRVGAWRHLSSIRCFADLRTNGAKQELESPFR